MKYKLYFVSLIAPVSVLATFALRTYVPSVAAKKASGDSAVKGDVIGTRRGPSPSWQHHTSLSDARQESQTRFIEAYRKLPLSFEANHGQADPKVKFLSRGHGYSVLLTSSEAVLTLQGNHGRPTDKNSKARMVEKALAHRPLSGSTAFGLLLRLGIPPSQHRTFLPQRGGDPRLMRSETQGSPGSRATAALRLKLIAANPVPQVTGVEELPGKSNYFLGKDPRKWRTNVPTYGKVKYAGVYPGVDLVYYGNQGQLEYDFIVAPGANPRAVALSIEGAKRLNVDSQGDLVVDMSGEVVRFHKPAVYQPHDSRSEIQNQKLKIDGRYVLQGQNIGFEVAAYDTSKPLIIDPVLSYSTYLGGSGDDISGFLGLDSIATDPLGNAYLIGSTTSTDFPTTAGAFQTTFGGTGDFYFSGDAFVAKLNSAGSRLLYSTYIGGSGDEQGESLAVDAAGNAYISGETFSTDFPTVNPIQAAYAGGGDSFVAKLNSAGNALVYSTYLGGSDWDPFPMIEIDGRGIAYLQGSTFSTDFPTTPGAFQTALASPPDTYVTKVNAAGNALLYSTYLGGTGEELCGAQIAVDRFGNVYVNGETNSTDFPTTPGAIQAALVPGTCGDAPDTFPCHDGFLAKLNQDGTGLVYSTYLGGSDFELTLGTAVDPGGNAYISGVTFSTDFPTKNPIQAAYAGGGDAFVAKVNAAGKLVYSTYWGGADFEAGRDNAVGRAGNNYVTGITFSTDFPTINPIQAANAGLDDTFVTVFNAAGKRIVYSTYLGGSGFDEPGGIVLDPFGNVYIGGLTASSEDFPLVNAFQPIFGGGSLDAFVAKISPQ